MSTTTFISEPSSTGSKYPADCISASPGHYVDQPGQSSQTAADAGYYVPLNGQSSQIACSTGTFQSSTGSYYCDDADAGYYVDQIGQSTQVQCPSGYTTITTRSTTPYQCLSDYDGDTIVDVFDSDDDDVEEPERIYDYQFGEMLRVSMAGRPSLSTTSPTLRATC